MMVLIWSLSIYPYIFRAHSYPKPGDLLKKSRLDHVIPLQQLPLPSEEEVLTQLRRKEALTWFRRFCIRDWRTFPVKGQGVGD